jgi:hypothetical protein
VKRSRLMGPRLCWTFFSWTVQPLKTRAYPLWEYSDCFDPILKSEEELPRSEVAARVADMVTVAGDTASVFDGHPQPLSLANPGKNMSPLTPFLFLVAFCRRPPFLVSACIVSAPGQDALPPAPVGRQGEGGHHR